MHLLQIRRPHDYDPRVAAAHGPTQPGKYVDAAALGVISTQVGEGPNKLYVGGLPHYMPEKQVCCATAKL